MRMDRQIRFEYATCGRGKKKTSGYVWTGPKFRVFWRKRRSAATFLFQHLEFNAGVTYLRAHKTPLEI